MIGPPPPHLSLCTVTSNKDKYERIWKHRFNPVSLLKKGTLKMVRQGPLIDTW